jgi:AAA15 family ATPase/GTPase
MKIKKVILDNFRAFKHAEIDFNNFNCIIGKNDTGKSTILAALEWFFDPKKELNENDFAAAGFDWHLITEPSYYNEIEETAIPERTYKEFISVNLCVSVELYLSDVVIPKCSKKYDFIFDKDYINDEGCVRVRKYMYHPMYSDWKGSMGYSIVAYQFNKTGRTLSDCSFEEVKTAYSEIGENAEALCNTLKPLEEELKGKRGIAFSAIRSKIRDEEAHIKEQMCNDLYKYYNGIGEIRKENWIPLDHNDEQTFPLDLPAYKLYTSKTRIEDYLNDLFTPKNATKLYKALECAKTQTIKKLAEYLNLNDKEDKFDFLKDEKINLFSQNSLIFTPNDSPLNIPITNRGEGVQLKIKNAVFRLLTDIQQKQQQIIFAFEEPETHLHPSAQIEMYETIKALSENSNYQVIITTHSPYIVKELAKDKILPIVVLRDEENNVSTISKLDETVLSHDDYVSMNEINYIAFEEPSVEYHQELFAFLQGGKQTVDQVDNLFKKEYDWFQVDNKGKLVITNGSPIEKKHSLPYCVRNQIDHPTVDDTNDKIKHNAYLNNSHFNEKELIRKSIEIMRNAIMTLTK